MSSKPIYPHVPYFYIIEHVASGKKYAGCRFAKGCHPSEFMTEGGYCTSSKVVKKIIKKEGIDAFKIIEIKTLDEVGDVYEYETKFLVENNCAKSEQWLKKHNNTGIRVTFGTEEFKDAMRAEHGVEYSMQSEACKEKSRQTCLKNHGVECSFKSEEVKEKSRQTCLKNRGVEYPMQSEEVKEKSRQTCSDRYGHEHSMQSEDVKEKHRQTMLKNHGVEYQSQRKEHRERSSKLLYERFDLKVRTEILNGDFNRFVYLYDNVEHVFLVGVEKSLNRGLETKRYIMIGACRGYKQYVDVLTGKTYKIDASKFSRELPNNFYCITEFPLNVNSQQE